MAQYKVLKKYGDFKKGEIFEGPENPSPEEQATIDEAVEAGQLKLIEEKSNEGSDGKGQVTFKLINKNAPTGHSERVFSHAEHGEDYEALADSFEEANKSNIISREE